MPTKRNLRRGRRGGGHITLEAIAAFKRALELYYDDRKGEEYFHARLALHRMLGREPPQECILATVGRNAPPPWMNAAQAKDWRGAQALRVALEEAVESEDA